MNAFTIPAGFQSTRILKKEKVSTRQASYCCPKEHCTVWTLFSETWAHWLAVLPRAMNLLLSDDRFGGVHWLFGSGLNYLPIGNRRPRGSQAFEVNCYRWLASAHGCIFDCKWEWSCNRFTAQIELKIIWTASNAIRLKPIPSWMSSLKWFRNGLPSIEMHIKHALTLATLAV